jgi:hypothetical protein
MNSRRLKRLNSLCPRFEERAACYSNDMSRSGGSVTHFEGRWETHEMSPPGPERRLLRDGNTSEIGGKAEVAGARSK